MVGSVCDRFSGLTGLGEPQSNGRDEAYSHRVEQDVGERALTSREVGLVDFVANGNRQGNQRDKEKTNLDLAWIVRKARSDGVKTEGHEREDQKHGQETIEGDMEEAIGVKFREPLCKRRVSKDEDPCDVSSRKEGEKRSHLLQEVKLTGLPSVNRWKSRS